MAHGFSLQSSALLIVTLWGGRTWYSRSLGDPAGPCSRGQLSGEEQRARVDGGMYSLLGWLILVVNLTYLGKGTLARITSIKSACGHVCGAVSPYGRAQPTVEKTSLGRWAWAVHVEGEPGSPVSLVSSVCFSF